MKWLAQADDIQLLPDTAELIWGVVVFLIVLGLFGGMLHFVMGASRARRRQEARLRRLEERMDQVDPKR